MVPPFFLIMKIVKLIIISIIQLIPIGGYSYDFGIDGIYYNILSLRDLTVEVTNNGWYNAYGSSFGTTINIPETVEYMGKQLRVIAIGDEAFMCVNNTERNGTVSIPSSIRRIGKRAFNSFGISKIKLPEGLEIIDENAFWDTKLTSIDIPATVNKIGDAAFSAIKELSKIHVDEDNPYYDSRENSNTIIETETNTLIAACNNSVFPSTIKHFGNYVFFNFSLTSIVIPESIETIGDYCFSFCTSLTSIQVPQRVSYIGKYAFLGCEKLSSFECSPNVEYISEGVFEGCYQLTTIKLPSELVSIGDRAFNYCIKLEDIYLPSSLKTIGENSFYGCQSLREINIPVQVQNIGNSAFYECSNLGKIRVFITNPINIEKNCFPDLCYMLSTLYVPNGCKEVYNNAPIWKNFSDIQEFDPTGIRNVAKSYRKVRIYNTSGRLIDKPQKGLYIIQKEDRSSNKVVIK